MDSKASSLPTDAQTNQATQRSAPKLVGIVSFVEALNVLYFLLIPLPEPKGGKAPQIWNLQICSNGQYCCRDAETRKSCCDDEDNLFDFNIGKFQAQATSTTTVFLEATGSGTQTVVPVTVTASSAATCDEGAQEQAGPVSSCSGPSALVVGSAVGGTMGAALLAAVAAIVFLCRRKPATGSLTYPSQTR